MSTTRRSLTTAGAATLLAAIALAGCSGDEPTAQDPQVTASPVEDDAATSTAPQVDDAAQTSSAPVQEDDAEVTSEPEETEEPALGSSDGTFEITLPDGWEDALELAGDDAVWAARQTERLDEFHTNVTVTQEEYVGNLTPAVENTAEELAGEDGEYEILEPAEVDGHSAPGYTLVREVQGVTLNQTQRWISRDGTLHVVTFSAVAAQAEEAAPVLDEILASWTWTD